MTDNSNMLCSRQKILIVDDEQTRFGLGLKRYLKRFDNDVYVSPRIPESIPQFDYCFFINEKTFLKKTGNFESWKKIILVIGNDQKIANSTKNTFTN